MCQSYFTPQMHVVDANTMKCRLSFSLYTMEELTLARKYMVANRTANQVIAYEYELDLRMTVHVVIHSTKAVK